MPRPIRVAYVLLSDQAGGAERQMLALAERLPRDRFAPELIVRSAGGEYVERALRGGIKVRATDPASPAAVEGGPRAAVVHRLRSRGARALRLVGLIRSGRYDLVDAWLYPADVAIALTRPLTHGPLVISGRRNLDPHDRFGRLERLVERAANRLTDTVVANSAAAARHAVATQGVDPARLRIIRNGVEIPDPISPEERAARRRALGHGPDALIVGGMASYSPAKRLDVLIDAFAAVARDAPAARLELIGEGTLRRDLEAQIRSLDLEERICLHGFVPDPERLYPAFDIVALSSDREGMPNALLEAGAAGRPIVATTAGGVEEIVTDGHDGLLVPIGDVDAFARALGRLVHEPDLRDRLARAIRPSVARTFGMDRFVAEFAGLYEERVDAARRRSGRAGSNGDTDAIGR